MLPMYHWEQRHFGAYASMTLGPVSGLAARDIGSDETRLFETEPN